MPAVRPLVIVWAGTAAVLLPRFQETTFGPPPAVDRTLAEVAVGQLVVAAALSAPALNTYSPSSDKVHVQTKLTPVVPAGTVAVAGVGAGHRARPPLTESSEGDTFETVTLLLFTFN